MQDLTIKEIKERLKSKNIDKNFFQALKADPRKGVKTLVKTLEKQEQQKLQLEKQFQKMRTIENHLIDRGYSSIVGIDEAGRGPLAGPVTAAAVILPQDFKLLGLTDSKQLNENTRDKFYDMILDQALAAEVVFIDNDTIDQTNILEATKTAMRQAVAQLDTPIDYVLIDAVDISPLPYPSKSIIKGDAKSITIAAASILAKVARDREMARIHKQYPVYQLDQNKGYGTKEHLLAIEKYGATPYHRKTFAPVRERLK